MSRPKLHQQTSKLTYKSSLEESNSDKFRCLPSVLFAATGVLQAEEGSERGLATRRGRHVDRLNNRRFLQARRGNTRVAIITKIHLFRGRSFSSSRGGLAPRTLDERVLIYLLLRVSPSFSG